MACGPYASRTRARMRLARSKARRAANPSADRGTQAQRRAAPYGPSIPHPNQVLLDDRRYFLGELSQVGIVPVRRVTLEALERLLVASQHRLKVGAVECVAEASLELVKGRRVFGVEPITFGRDSDAFSCSGPSFVSHTLRAGASPSIARSMEQVLPTGVGKLTNRGGDSACF